ncbi:MAG: hypothetical protein PHI28_05150 [Mangrovibacterium sp.]|nr:hypothetical protein [Mangrovibacterium sp.]
MGKIQKGCKTACLWHIALAACMDIFCFTGSLSAQELRIGTASADISPELPVALSGQFELRIAKTAETPLTANVIALESTKNGCPADTAIMVGCDLTGIPYELVHEVRDAVSLHIPGFDVRKIVLNATHTHTSPVVANDLDCWGYRIPDEGVTQAEAYRSFVVRQITGAIVQAWNSRSSGTVSWGLSDAVVGYNRRVAYADGSTRMYGETDDPLFRNIEGYEDHGIQSIFFWNKENRLVAMIINLACPAQEVEGRTAVNADYWHPVRENLKKHFGPELCVLGWISAAGDQSPRPMYRKAAEERMVKLRNISRMEEISRRIVRAVTETYEVVKHDRHQGIPLIHRVETVALPLLPITAEQSREAEAVSREAARQMAADPKAADQVYSKMKWYGDVVRRFEKQKANPHATHTMELHVLRMGDIAVCATEWELFTDYGIRIQARSKAVQTFVIQLAGPDTYYLPTEKAVRGGSYSAIPASNLIGPEGGQILTDKVTELINSLW